MRAPTGDEIELLKMVAEIGQIDDLDHRLVRFCEPEGTTFTRCRSAGWLVSIGDAGSATTESSTVIVKITKAGREALEHAVTPPIQAKKTVTKRRKK